MPCVARTLCVVGVWLKLVCSARQGAAFRHNSAVSVTSYGFQTLCGCPDARRSATRALFESTLHNPDVQSSLRAALAPMDVHPIFLSSLELFNTFDALYVRVSLVGTACSVDLAVAGCA